MAHNSLTWSEISVVQNQHNFQHAFWLLWWYERLSVWSCAYICITLTRGELLSFSSKEETPKESVPSVCNALTLLTDRWPGSSHDFVEITPQFSISHIVSITNSTKVLVTGEDWKVILMLVPDNKLLHNTLENHATGTEY